MLFLKKKERSPVEPGLPEFKKKLMISNFNRCITCKHTGSSQAEDTLDVQAEPHRTPPRIHQTSVLVSQSSSDRASLEHIDWRRRCSFFSFFPRFLVLVSFSFSLLSLLTFNLVGRLTNSFCCCSFLLSLSLSLSLTLSLSFFGVFFKKKEKGFLSF